MRSSFGGLGSNVFEGAGGNVFEGLSGNVFEGHRGFADIFGFGQVAVTPPAGYIVDPYYTANQLMAEEAKVKLAEFQKSVALIPKLPLQEQRDKAMSIVKTNWYKAGILGFGGGMDLDTLATKVASYANEKVFHQYAIKAGEIDYSDTRVKRYEAFKDGNTALRNYLRQFLPVDVRTQVIEKPAKEILFEVGLSAESLLEKALTAATRARSTRVATDAAEARGLALAAFEASKAEGHEGYMTTAKDLADEMEALVLAIGGPAAAVKQGTSRDEFPWTPVLIAGGAALAVIGVVLVVTKK